MNVTFIPPKSIFNMERFTLLHRAHMRVIATKVEREFNSTVKSWDSKTRPRFSVKYTRDEILVTTDSELYALVDAGSPEHPIAPRGPWLLRFQNKYRAKTSPGVIGSTSGGKSGDVVTARVIRRHPGFQARKFVDAIKKRNDFEFFKSADQVIAEANK